MKAYDIVGYTYKAETLHPSCLVDKLIRTSWASPAARDLPEESVLDAIAEAREINREDEYTFDSDDFPKVVFADSVQDDERCDACGNSLI